MNRNIRLIKIHTICTNMLFVLPVIVLYYQAIGLGFREFLIGEAVFSAVVLFAEVPSGWISDTWKRRSTLILGAFFGICGLSLLMIADNFWMATAAQGIIGLAVALNSGTNTALLYDTLHEEGREDDYRRVDGDRHSFGIYGTALSCIVGALLFSLHPKLPLLFDILIMLVAMIAIACVREPKRHQKSVEKHVFRDLYETMKYALSGHPEITGIIMVSTVVLCTTKLMLWAQQPYYTMIGIPVEWFGVIMAGSFALGGMAGQFSHRIEHWGSNRAALGFAALVLSLACFALILWPLAALAVPLFLTGTLAYATMTPRINNAINSRVGSERRATILSTASLMVHLLFIPTSVLVGYLSDHGGITASLWWIGAQLFVLSAIGLWLWGRRNYSANSTITGT